MRIVVFNVKYSPNLGDGLLSECIEAELREQAPGVEARSIDLAGREAYGDGFRHRQTALMLLDRLPGFLRRQVAGLALNRMAARLLGPRSEEAIGHADAVVLGGGNLLADADLNFPIKVACALDRAADAGRPLGVFGVGVSDNWSSRGSALFGNALRQSRIAHAAVRDTRSQGIWERNLAPYGVRAPTLCRDPGLLAVRHYPRAEPDPNTIGLCITSPVALRYHGGGDERGLDGWLLALGELLVKAGHRLALFTNGSPEDRDYLARLAPRFQAALGDAVAIVPAFADPAGLAHFISGCALVIAHRMHACIAAYSFGVPHVGLAWDPKLDSFFASVDRQDFVVQSSRISPARAAALAARALNEGIDGGIHARVLAEARADVAALFTALQRAVDVPAGAA